MINVVYVMPCCSHDLRETIDKDAFVILPRVMLSREAEINRSIKKVRHHHDLTHLRLH